MKIPQKSKSNKVIFVIGIILLLISLALAIAYYTSVKFNQCASDPLTFAEQRVMEVTTAGEDDVSATLMINNKYYIFDKGILKPMPEIVSFKNFNP